MSHCRVLDTSLVSNDMYEFSYRLTNEPLFLPDVLRDVKKVMGVAEATFDVCQQPFALVGGDNKMGGAFFMSDIVPGHEGALYIWTWNPKVITATTLRFMDDYICSIADEYQLVRVVARTPDKKLCRLLRALKFKEEGRFSKGFRTGGKSLVLYQLRRLW